MSLSTKFDVAANAATIVVAGLISVFLIRGSLAPRVPRQPLPRSAMRAGTLASGTNIKGTFPQVDWFKNGHTLVLALSTQCHYCKASAPFFRKLSDGISKNLKVVAVLPQSVSESQEYLKSEGIRVDEIKQAALPTIGVSGTPTMILADSKGVVSDVWVGMLGPDEQKQVMAKVLQTEHSPVIAER